MKRWTKLSLNMFRKLSFCKCKNGPQMVWWNLWIFVKCVNWIVTSSWTINQFSVSFEASPPRLAGKCLAWMWWRSSDWKNKTILIRNLTFIWNMCLILQNNYKDHNWVFTMLPLNWFNSTICHHSVQILPPNISIVILSFWKWISCVFSCTCRLFKLLLSYLLKY